MQQRYPLHYARPRVLTLEDASRVLVTASALLMAASFVSHRLSPYVDMTTDGNYFLLFSLVMEVGFFILPTAYLLSSKGLSWRTVFGWRPLAKAQIPWIFAMAFFAMLAVTGFQMLWTVAMEAWGIPYGLGEETGGSFLLSLVTVSLGAGFSEEILVRGTLLPPMERRWGRGAAIALSAAVFSLMHGEVARLPYTFLLGLLLAWIAIRAGTIKSSILFHALYNAMSVIIDALTSGAREAVDLVQANPYADPVNWPSFCLTGGFMLFIGGIFLAMFAIGFAHRCPASPRLLRDPKRIAKPVTAAEIAADPNPWHYSDEAHFPPVIPLTLFVSIFLLLLRVIWTTLEMWP